jgi:hypothetical protein
LTESARRRETVCNINPAQDFITGPRRQMDDIILVKARGNKQVQINNLHKGSDILCAIFQRVKSNRHDTADISLIACDLHRHGLSAKITALPLIPSPDQHIADHDQAAQTLFATLMQGRGGLAHMAPEGGMNGVLVS